MPSMENKKTQEFFLHVFDPLILVALTHSQSHGPPGLLSKNRQILTSPHLGNPARTYSRRPAAMFFCSSHSNDSGFFTVHVTSAEELQSDCSALQV